MPDFQGHRTRSLQPSFWPPACPHCQIPMKKARVSPETAGVDHHEFSCPKCAHVHGAQRSQDPIDRPEVDSWLKSELRPPD